MSDQPKQDLDLPVSVDGLRETSGSLMQPCLLQCFKHHYCSYDQLRSSGLFHRTYYQARLPFGERKKVFNLQTHKSANALTLGQGELAMMDVVTQKWSCLTGRGKVKV